MQRMSIAVMSRRHCGKHSTPFARLALCHLSHSPPTYTSFHLCLWDMGTKISECSSSLCKMAQEPGEGWATGVPLSTKQRLELWHLRPAQTSTSCLKKEIYELFKWHSICIKPKRSLQNISGLLKHPIQRE